MSRITPVILCGGKGTRLWPRSRATRPKPFLPLIGEQSLFAQTLKRVEDSCLFAPPLIVTGTSLVQYVDAEIGHEGDTQVIVEPEGKNTAAAIALAAHRLPSDAVMLICPSDHFVRDTAAFLAAAAKAAALARKGWMVSIGIPAARPETGFGYLERGAPIEGGGFRVDRFVEKPDLEQAETFVASGEYVWNSGIFALGTSQYLSQLESFRPQLAKLARQAASGGSSDRRYFHPEPDIFGAIVAESIDYAVMEHTPDAALVMSGFDWSDIGSWEAVHRARDRDASGNSTQGPVELIDCRNTLVDSDGVRVHVVGLDDVIVVADGEDILITRPSEAQKLRDLKGANARDFDRVD